MTDILERLRTKEEWKTLVSRDEAAAEIERLRIIAADYQALQHRANAIDDENERLRTALQQIVHEADSDDGISAWDGSDIARRALEQEEPNLGVDAKGNPHPF